MDKRLPDIDPKYLLEQQIKPHAEALRDACADITAQNSGKRIIAALTFSGGPFPFLSPRHHLRAHVAKDHYDLMGQIAIIRARSLANLLGYELYLPLGTLGKMANHFVHRSEFVKRIINASIKEDFGSVVLENLPANWFDGLDSEAKERVVVGELGKYADTAFVDRIRFFSDLMKDNVIHFPMSLYSREELLKLAQPAETLQIMSDALLSSRLSNPNNNHTLEHNMFEARMDALNFQMVLRGRDSPDARTVYLFGSGRRKRNFGSIEASNYGRHIATLFHWVVFLDEALDSATSPESDIRADAFASLELKTKLINEIEANLKRVVQSRGHLYDGLSNSIGDVLWKPFLAALTREQNLPMPSRSDTRSPRELIRASLHGDSTATKALIADIKKNNDEAMEILWSSIDAENVDELMVALPTPEDDARFNQIKKIIEDYRKKSPEPS